MFKKLLFASFLALAFHISAAAQEVEVDRYNITARIDLAASALDARASVTISNLGQSPKSALYFRLTKIAKVSAASVNGAPAQVDTSEDRRISALNQIIVRATNPVAPGATATVEITYRIEAPESTLLASVDAGEVLMTPDLVWFPMPSTMFTPYGATSAPFTLSVTAPQGFRVASSGALKASGQTFTFDQPLNSLPFIVAGQFDEPVASVHGGVHVEVWPQPGYTSSPESRDSSYGDMRKQSARLGDEAGRIIAFLTKTLGPPPQGANFRVISSPRIGNLAVPGAFVINQRIFRQGVLDAETIEGLADAIARMWTEGRVRIRGRAPRSAQAGAAAGQVQSAALVRDSLPRYLAALYFEERFGKDAGGLAFERMRWNYTPVAKSQRDAELDIQIPLSTTYTAAVYNKGPLVLRLMAETGGREKLFAVVRQLFTGPQTRIVDLDDFRQESIKATGPQINSIFQQWVDTIIEPDIIIGIPQPTDQPGVQRVNLRNLGKGDVTLQVLAVTESGKHITTSVTVPSEGLTSTDIQTAEKISSVEVDPEKLIIQTDYDNDAKPARPAADTLLNEAVTAFTRGVYAEAEEKLRQGVRSYPHNPRLHAWLARTLAARDKLDEAVTEANAAINIEPPMISALAWAHITLGQVALARNQAAEAVKPLRLAVIEATETPAQYAARETLVRAERAANASVPVEESLRAFINKLDSFLKQPSSDQLFTIVSRNTLKGFVQRLAVTPPTGWTTEILRVEYTDANRASLDVAIRATTGGREQSGTAVLILRREGSGWILEDVPIFNVK
ncbi:MAG: hypothetical protein L0229_31055 [Blastocatellia bacterium]|nr:hypothetical protein [Blastocatellia bacterium]